MQTNIIKINSKGEGTGFFKDKKIFIPKTCVGEIVEFNILEEHKEYINAKLIKIIKKSDDRLEDIKCPFYEKCGGCNLLHFNDKAYYEYKENIIRDSINKIGYKLDKFDLIKIPENSRRRITFQVKDKKIGFFERGTTNLIEVDYCLLVKNEINDIIKILKELVKKIQIDEIFVTSHNNGLEILFNLKKRPELKEEEILKELMLNDNIIIASYKIGNEDPTLIFQKQTPYLILSDNTKLELVPNIFLQATSRGQNSITDIVVQELKNCKNVLDLYCGIGTYSFPLAKYIKVHSVEGNQRMINILNYNVKLNRLSDKISFECRNLVNSPLLVNELKKYDGVVINPPRNGANAQCKIIAKSNIKNIVMVSCNPVMFANDSRELKSGGYSLNKVVGIDQFYRTPHLEIIGVFEKDN